MTTESIFPQAILHRSLRALVALAARQGLVQGVNLLGSTRLARLFSPGEYGTHAIVLFFAGLVGRVATSGLSANLVRQAEEPGEIDYRAVFTAQAGPIVVLPTGGYRDGWRGFVLSVFQGFYVFAAGAKRIELERAGSHESIDADYREEAERVLAAYEAKPRG
ncbi:oligosaccharide flippase family protein [bacterium]|nr:oligosaccharide flippase family protein [bacterium]